MNILGIDFEDWYHPELMKPYISVKDKNPTVINGIDKILELLRKNETFATFFLVGELLLVKPELQDKILDEGHEIAFHTMYHTRLDSEGYKEKFLDEVKIFEKLTSGKSKGFRAPTFSLNDTSSWIIDILRECVFILYCSKILCCCVAIRCMCVSLFLLLSNTLSDWNTPSLFLSRLRTLPRTLTIS